MKAIGFFLGLGMELFGLVLFATLMGFWPAMALVLFVGGRTIISESRHDYKMGWRK